MVCREENQFVHRQNARDLSEQGNLANKPDHLISRLETTLVWLFVEIPWLCVVPIILCQPIKNIQCISSRLKREIWSLSALKETMILEQSHDVQKPSVLLPTGTKFIGSYGQWKKWETRSTGTLRKLCRTLPTVVLAKEWLIDESVVLYPLTLSFLAICQSLKIKLLVYSAFCVNLKELPPKINRDVVPFFSSTKGHNQRSHFTSP